MEELVNENKPTQKRVAKRQKEKRSKIYVWGSIGLDQDAGSDRGHGGGHRALEALGRQQGAQIMVIRVNQAAEEATSNGKGGSLDDGGRESAGTGGADHLVDAERVGCQGEGGDGDLGGA